MLTFEYKMNGVPTTHYIKEYTGKESTPAEIRNAVNDEWEELKRNPDIDYATLRGVITLPGEQPTVMLPPKDRPMTWGIWGKFTEVTKNGKAPKLYPFECDKCLKAGQRFLAMPGGVPAIAIVHKCSWTERDKVVAAANGHKLYKIKDLVEAV